MQNENFMSYKTDTEIPAYLPLPRFLVPLDLSKAKKKLHRSRQVTTRAFQELERFGLIVRRKQGLGRPAVITLNIIAKGKGGQAE